MFVKTLVVVVMSAVQCFGSDLLSQMSLEEKVGQLLMVQFHGELANDNAKTLIQDTKVGGIIYYNWSNGLTSPEQVRTLSAGLQQLTKENRISIPLLIAADQEGGVVARLQGGFTEFPGNRALGVTSEPQLARESALISGQEMRSVGVNMNLAPVVDVNNNPKNPVIGIRSFSDDPETVVAFGAEALEGFRQAGIISTLKHFPGHGDVTIDSHEDLPIIHKSLRDLEQCELVPFAKLGARADAIMTAHILIPAIDPDNCSTLSAKTLTYLRETLGFQGLIVSDSLVMGGVLKKCHSVDEASILALNAGCDLLILGGKLLTGEHLQELTPADVERVARSIVEAVRSGRVSETRVDAAVSRILVLKNHEAVQAMEFSKLINAPESRAVASRIAVRGLKSSAKGSRQIGPLREQHLLVVAPQLLQNNIEKTTLLQLGKSTNSFFFQGLNPSLVEREMANQLAKDADVIVVCSYNSWKNPSAIELIRALQNTDKSLVLLSLRDPTDSSIFPEANIEFRSFSPTTPSIQAICDQLSENY